MIELPVRAIDVVEAAGAAGAEISKLREICHDPAQMFMLSPVLLRIRDLAAIYADDPSGIPDLMTVIRRRMTEERWNEQRARFQSTRLERQRDAVIDLEAAVLATIAVDFHARRVTDAVNRWSALSSYVEDALTQCAAGMRAFTPDLRDACKELREMETCIEAMLPSTSAGSAADRLLNESKGRRADLVSRVGSQLASIRGADASSNVLTLVRNSSNTSSALGKNPDVENSQNSEGENVG